ncbi:von Willebrand factor A-like protein [Gracilaria domingensis]|nr:von Willebrand factor A-like protein [Gracilaria domingensis]
MNDSRSVLRASLLSLLFAVALSYPQVADEYTKHGPGRTDSPLTNHAARQAQNTGAVATSQPTRYNPEVCFAIDGSEYWGLTGFQLQKDFVKLVAAAIEGRVPRFKHAGVQFWKPISPLNEDVSEFLHEVDTTEYMNATNSFIGLGIAECWRHLKNVNGQPQKIVLFLHSDYNDITFQLAITMAQKFLDNPGNSLYAVGLGSFEHPGQVESLAGAPHRIFLGEQWADLFAAVPSLVTQICTILVGVTGRT